MNPPGGISIAPAAGIELLSPEGETAEDLWSHWTTWVPVLEITDTDLNFNVGSGEYNIHETASGSV